MSGKFNPIYVSTTLQTLEKHCFTLLGEGYSAIKSTAQISIDWEEEDISKALIQSIKTNKNRIKWKISIVPEYRIYKDNNLAAKKAPRIDFRFSCWTENEWEYFAEAKNLIEIDSQKKEKKGKKGNIITVCAKHLRERYIETGIDNYISGKYSVNGCLVGYILQGKIENIVCCLNQYLCNSNRTSEILNPYSLENISSCYISAHDNSPSIKHLMFDFTQN